MTPPKKCYEFVGDAALQLEDFKEDYPDRGAAIAEAVGRHIGRNADNGAFIAMSRTYNETRFLKCVMRSNFDVFNFKVIYEIEHSHVLCVDFSWSVVSVPPNAPQKAMLFELLEDMEVNTIE